VLGLGELGRDRSRASPFAGGLVCASRRERSPSTIDGLDFRRPNLVKSSVLDRLLII